MSKQYSFSLKELARLLEESAAYKDEPIEFLRNRYEKHASNFDEVLEFLISLKLVRKKGHSLMASQQLRKIEHPTTLEQIIKDALLRSSNFSDVHQLIFKFEAKEGKFEYAPNRSERFVESGVRNLLITLGIVRYDRSKDAYTLDPNHYHEAFASSTDRHRKLSLKAFRAIQANKEFIGSAAEDIVLDYEKQRLSQNPELVDKILHIAEVDIGAGYDIESFEAPDNATKRLIEVKAVSPLDFGFEWSANEVKVAEKMQERYYLYLLPVIKGKPSISDAVIIQNPADVVLKEQSWEKQISGYFINNKTVKNIMDLDLT